MKDIVHNLLKMAQRSNKAADLLKEAAHLLNEPDVTKPKRPRRVLSESARKKIADAQRARWKKWKADKKAA